MQYHYTTPRGNEVSSYEPMTEAQLIEWDEMMSGYEDCWTSRASRLKKTISPGWSSRLKTTSPTATAGNDGHLTR